MEVTALVFRVNVYVSKVSGERTLSPLFSQAQTKQQLRTTLVV